MLHWLLVWKLLKRKRCSSSDDDGGERVHSRYKKAFYNSLSAEDRRRRSRKLRRPALLPVKRCPWRKALASQDNEALITITGFDYDSLKYVFAKFAPVFDNHTPFMDDQIVRKNPKKGRK